MVKPNAWRVTWSSKKYPPKIELRSPLVFVFCKEECYACTSTPYTITPLWLTDEELKHENDNC